MLAERKRPGTRGRRGISLQEMLVVLAIVVSLAGSAWPSLRGSLEKSQLRSGAKQLRTELAKTRLTAIESGEAYALRYQAGTALFQVAPVSALKDIDDDSFDSSVLDQASQTAPQITDLELPEGVLFSDAESKEAELERDEFVGAEPKVEDFDEAESLEWSAPIVFYPNGRTSSAQIDLQNDQGHRIKVSLRGLTGSATVGELKKPEVDE